MLMYLLALRNVYSSQWIHQGFFSKFNFLTIYVHIHILIIELVYFCKPTFSAFLKPWFYLFSVPFVLFVFIKRNRCWSRPLPQEQFDSFRFGIVQCYFTQWFFASYILSVNDSHIVGWLFVLNISNVWLCQAMSRLRNNNGERLS